MLVECDRDPLVPVTVTVKVPDAEEEAEQDRVLFADEPRLKLDGVNEHVKTPVPPVTVDDKTTVPENPFKLAIVTVDVPVVPPDIPTEPGFATIEKSGAFPTVNVKLAV